MILTTSLNKAEREAHTISYIPVQKEDWCSDAKADKLNITCLTNRKKMDRKADKQKQNG